MAIVAAVVVAAMPVLPNVADAVPGGITHSLPLTQTQMAGNAANFNICHHAVCNSSNRYWAQDLFAGQGVPIRNVLQGFAQVSGWDNSCGYRIRVNFYGFNYLYCHMTGNPSYAVNAFVPTGAQMGTMGKTGSGSGNTVHLHLEIRQLTTVSNWGGSQCTPASACVPYCSQKVLASIYYYGSAGATNPVYQQATTPYPNASGTGSPATSDCGTPS